MEKKRNPINWSDKRYKQKLVEQRKHMWHKDTVDKLADWMGLKSGMTGVDVGCGLGFLGYTFWPYFGDGGHYIGIDISAKLLRDSSMASRDWASGGDAGFVNADTYRLPLADNSVDLAMCQTLLMHLTRPRNALAELTRITKPSGLVICIEPDNLSSELIKRNWSLPELSTDELLLFFKITLVSNKGRIKLGRGDNSIGIKVTHMMSELGLVDIDARQNDTVWFTEPPYEGEVQQYRLKMAKRNFLDEKYYKFFRKKEREEFLAGGGDPKDFDRYVEISDRLRPIAKEQFDKGEFYGCGSNDFYTIKGKKP
ncbi:MAG: methyltransferase domain-containing protein [candidate division Zixibacteria bacterium]|nr:methyltransferase domain-containing protein [candidate division Zixibacteria bacterium]